VRVYLCAYYKATNGYGVEVIMVGHGVTPLFCRTFNHSFRGRRVHWKYGKTRCLFSNHRRSIELGIRTRNATVGRSACLAAKPGLRRSGFHQVPGP